MHVNINPYKMTQEVDFIRLSVVVSYIFESSEYLSWSPDCPKKSRSEGKGRI
jgi:hypothetical protein